MKSVIWVIGLALVVGCSTDNILSYGDQLKKDTKAIDTYLAKNGIVATIDTLTGLRIVVSEAGAGLFPGIEAKVTVRYTGTLLNGNAFTPTDALATDAPLQQLIQGWQIAFVKYVAKGGKATLYIPSGLAYGNAGKAPSIPGNSNLIFHVELLGYNN